MYLTDGDAAFPTAIAEAFQLPLGTVGPIDRTTNTPAATAFDLADDLTLLDRTTGWVTRAGGNQAISAGPRPRSQAWARAIYDTHPDLDGLYYRSSIYGPGTCIALWERGWRAIPDRPALTRSLSSDNLHVPLTNAAYRLGTIIIG